MVHFNTEEGNQKYQTSSQPCWGRRLSWLRWDKLHWMNVNDQIWLRVCVQAFRCLHNLALGYLISLCQPISPVIGCLHLRLAQRGKLDYSHINLSTHRGRAFTYARPATWNCLPDDL